MARIYWISRDQHPPLAVLLCPRGGRELRDELRELQRDGIQTLVSLLASEQVEELDLSDEGIQAGMMGMQFIYHPMPDHSLPRDEAGFRELVSGLATRLRDGECVGIHCWASIGRATMVAACTLIHLGWDPRDALAAVETARGCQVPDTADQQEWILTYDPAGESANATNQSASTPEPADAANAEPVVDLSFQHGWYAKILADIPNTLPPRQFIYPTEVEEVESGALEVMVRPIAERALPFLATCAQGFRDPTVPTGIWSCPSREEICAVSGGYAYIIDTSAPENFTMIELRPVMEIRPLVSLGLLLFIGHHGVVAWGADGQAWESDKLSDEGVKITDIVGGILHGMGWDMKSDREVPFAVDLMTGVRMPTRS
jgi:protein-tyrosine phosphatase